MVAVMVMVTELLAGMTPSQLTVLPTLENVPGLAPSVALTRVSCAGRTSTSSWLPALSCWSKLLVFVRTIV